MLKIIFAAISALSLLFKDFKVKIHLDHQYMKKWEEKICIWYLSPRGNISEMLLHS